MSTQVSDYLPLLREEIAEAKAAGLEPAASELERCAVSAFTTSSEMLQAHGAASRRFVKATRRSLPRSTRAKLDACLIETEMASTGW